jgi:N-dimethylarginine dimethylaminohydrolase
MISSSNEWGRLRRVVVGSASNANWPIDDPVFAEESLTTTWKESPVPQGPVPDWIIQEANEDLAALCDILAQAGVTVERPKDMDFVGRDGMYNYCPRDRLLVAGDLVIDPAMMYPCRDQERENLQHLLHGETVIQMPRDQGMVLDAANILRMNDTYLYLESKSGNRNALKWLQEVLPHIKFELCNFYAGVHIDSTISVLREGLVVLNADRVSNDNVPRCLANWDKIWVHDVIAQDFYQYPYASKWIAMNMLSIDPSTVIIDAVQKDIIKKIEAKGLTVVPASLRHSRTLGGGFHCTTLDLIRD